MTADEENHLNELMRTLEIDQETFQTEYADLMPKLIVAKVNDGRMPVLPSVKIILKKAEIGHVAAAAALLKEIKVREYQGGYSGFSFRIVKGVRYHTGSTRGRSVVVGERLDVEDTGVLTITSQRAVYTGKRKTIEMPFSKLVSLEVFDDGVRFHVSNRKNAPLFKLEDGIGHVITAVVNAAVQKDE